MTIHIAKSFELSEPRNARYPLGLSVIVIVGLTLLGWAAIGLAAWSFI